MEIDSNWMPLTPGKPITDRSEHNYEAALTSEHVTEKEILVEEFPSLDSFDTMGYIGGSGFSCETTLTAEQGAEKENKNGEIPCMVNETREFDILDEREADLGVTGKDASSTASAQYDQKWAQEEAVRIPTSDGDGRKAHGVDESPIDIGSIPTPSKTDSKKRRNDGVDMNKKANQRRRVKKHRPKVYDDSQPKKVPKTKTPKRSTPRPKTPKPATQNRVKRKDNSRKNEFTSSGNKDVVQDVGSKDVAQDVGFEDVVQDVGFKDVVQDVGFEDVVQDDGFKDVVQDVQEASKNSITMVESCKRSLNFDDHLVIIESHPESKSHEEPPRPNFDIGFFDYFGKIVTSKRNTPRKSRFQKKNLEASHDYKYATRNEERAVENGRKYVHCYQRRKKINSSAITFTPPIKVYRRRENNCLQHSKICGPCFPKLYKKQRSLRKKLTINWWYDIAVEDEQRLVLRSNRKLVQTGKKTLRSTVNKPEVKKKKVKANFHTEEWLLRVFSPQRRNRSNRHTRLREDLKEKTINETMPYDDDSFLLCQEENFLQIPEFFPLQEVPIHRIESFTSLHSDFQPVENNVDSMNWLQLQEVPVIESQCLVSVKKKTLDTAKGLKNVHYKTIEFLIRKIASLDINHVSKELVVIKKNVSRALVEKVPKNGKFTPKVDIDRESLRVWKQLMENDGSEPVEQMDEDREEWWEAQRSVFRGRVDSFIAKMHLIQGNRRFSPWKGSVTDSVVGVYLTQNVSDHLSSSAFMNVAGRFPPKSRTKELTFDDELVNSQESVGSNTQIYERFSKNNEIEQDLSTSCADVSDASQSNEANQGSVSNPLLVQDNPCANEHSNTFRKRLDVEEGDFLKQFCSSPVSEPPVATFDLNVSVYDNSESEFLGQQNSTLEEEPEVVVPVSSLQSEVTSERLNGVDNQHHMKESSLSETKGNGKNKNKTEKKQEPQIDWEELRKSYCKSEENEVNEDHVDSADWDAVRHCTFGELAELIAERGMNNVIGRRIKEFLDRMHKEHGSHDLEWLRDVPPDKAKDFLLSIEGLGLKSVECVRLLTLHHSAFPVDTNVARVATRLGWVPLQPLPDQVQIHTLNAYPAMDTIQKYLFPRLCTLNQKTLYELHYQLITFGKVFCTKINPNCNACPMRAECRHYASAFASGRLAISGSKEGSSVTSIVPATNEQSHSMYGTQPSSFHPDVNNSGPTSYCHTCEPIIEVPPSPEREVEEPMPIIGDIEDLFCEVDDDEEIPIIRLNSDEFKETLKDTVYTNNISLPEADMSQAVVSFSAEVASVRVPKRFVVKMRTMHLVYELPDVHPCLAGFERREHDDPTPYLLAIWCPGEIRNSVEYTRNRVCISAHENQEETVQATVLIPCRTATRGSFPLNGTYFQVNEVFADDETSHIPMDVPRSQLRNLQIRELGCGSSATSIFKALSTGAIQRLFWRGSICVRGFNRVTRRPRPLHKKFHISTAMAAEDRKLAKR